MWRSVAGLLDIYRGEKISLEPDLEGFLFFGFFLQGSGGGGGFQEILTLAVRRRARF